MDVVIGELPKLTGTTADGVNAWREFGSWVGSLGDIQGTTLLVGAVSLGVILALRFRAPAVPGALVLVAGGILASRVFDLGGHGVDLVGHVPRGLPTPQLPSVDLFREQYATIGVAAGALLLIGFSQTAGDARAFATRHNTGSTSIRSRWRRAWRMPDRACSRACRSRPASPPAR